MLRQGVQGITDLITVPGLINLDFADVRTIMRDAGSALMGIGVASGENRAAEAAKNAISSPLLEESVEGATGILLNITGGKDLGLFEVNEAAEMVTSAADKNSNIIFGSVIDESLTDEVRVTVIATGFDGGGGPRRTTSARPGSRRDVVMDDRSRRELEIGDDDIDIPEFLEVTSEFPGSAERFPRISQATSRSTSENIGASGSAVTLRILATTGPRRLRAKWNPRPVMKPARPVSGRPTIVISRTWPASSTRNLSAPATKRPSMRPSQKKAWVSPVWNRSVTCRSSKPSNTLRYTSAITSRPSNGVFVMADWSTASGARVPTSASMSWAAKAAVKGWCPVSVD